MLCNFKPVSQTIHFNSLKEENFFICIPIRANKWERQVVHDFVRMVAAVRGDFSADRETLHAKVEVRALGALDPYLPGDVLVAVVAVIERLLAPSLSSSPDGG